MIKLNGVKKTYKSTTIRYLDRTFTQPCTLLIGQNGSGKTTLLKAIAQLIDVQGTIENTLSHIFVEEQPSFPEEMMVKDYLTLIQHLAKLKTAKRYQALIEGFKLNLHLDKPFKALSKGMRQKVHLTQALMIDRDLYLLDEPTTGLDQDAITQFIQWLKNEKAMVIIATHAQELFDTLTREEVYL